jgi:hypothetical protein
VNRIDVVNAAVGALEAERYLEIGVAAGECFHSVVVPTRVAVDPQFTFRPSIGARIRTVLRARTGTLYFETTSDAFFARHARRLAPFDVVFVDGLHTDEQAHRDVVHALDSLRAEGVVLVHDCNPQTAAAAAPTLEQAAAMAEFDGEWNGEVYRAILRLRTRDDLRVSVLDCDQGIGIIRRGSNPLRLALTAVEIDALSYAQLTRDRVALLDLRPPGDLAELLGAGPG